MNRKFRIMAGMAVAVAVCAAAVAPGASGRPAPGREYKNLKVLPKDISSKMLQEIMIDDFEDGLGVGCGFCHAAQKGSARLDYASDAKPEKEIARSMMRMTLKMNKKYFQLKHPHLGDATLAITCTTCHRGQPRPDVAE